MLQSAGNERVTLVAAGEGLFTGEPARMAWYFFVRSNEESFFSTEDWCWCFLPFSICGISKFCQR